MTQSEGMGLRILAVAILALTARVPASAQISADDPVTVATAHPRLLLNSARLRLLTRERQRVSPRWQQLETLVSGGAAMPEAAFAQALYYRISGDKAAGKNAVQWALGTGDDLRQLALIFDWCQDLLSETQSRDLAARIQKRMADTSADESVAATRSRVLAAIALFDHVPDAPRRELERVVRQWWLGKMVPALKQGRAVIARDDAYPLF
jgi:hypothetical protein